MKFACQAGWVVLINIAIAVVPVTPAIALSNPPRTAQNVAQATEDKSQSLEKYLQALPRLRASGDRRNEAVTLQAIGNIYSSLGENQKALKALKEALVLYKTLNVPPWDQANILYDIGVVYALLGDRQNALESFTTSLPIWEKGNWQDLGPFKYAESLNNIGDIYSSLGDKQKALDIYYKTLLFYVAPEYLSQEVKNTLIYSADAEKENLGFLNNLFEAFSAEDSVDPVNAIGRAFVLNKLGRLFLDLGSYKLSMKFFNLAKISQFQSSVTVEDADLRLAATTLNNMGLAHHGLGESKAALENFALSLQHRKALGDRRSEAIILNNQGLVYSKLGDHKKAIDLYRQAIPLSNGAGDRDTEAATLYNIASTYYGKGQFTEALTPINAAIALVESLRSLLNNDAFKTTYFATVQGYYQLKIDILMQLHRQNPTQGYDAQALETVDQSRARVLRELLIQANAKISKDISPDLLKQEQTLNQTLDAQETQLVQLSSQPDKEPQITALKQSIAQLYSDRDTLKNTIRLASPAYANLQYPKPITTKEIQQQLDPDTLMLQYSLGETQSYLWVISNSDLKTYILPKRSEIETTANTFRLQISDRDEFPKLKTTATQLTQQILTPAAAQLGKKRLVIIPDGELHNIPFAALNTPNAGTYNPLLTTHEITNLPSASTIAILRTTTATKPHGSKQIAILADPIFSKDDPRLLNPPSPKIAKPPARSRDLPFSRLPFTATEANGILNLVQNPTDRTAAFGFDASYDWMTNPKLSQYRYLHLATHGIFDPDRPALSSIVLSSIDPQGRDRKAYLRLPELFNLNLPTELVVLSACQTGLGKDIPGEGLVGMTRGLMYAGALRVSVSLWNVDDKSTSDLMQTFYTNLWQSKQSHAAALRNAQLALWNQNKSPYYWAAFTLQGEWRN